MTTKNRIRPIILKIPRFAEEVYWIQNVIISLIPTTFYSTDYLSRQTFDICDFCWTGRNAGKPPCRTFVVFRWVRKIAESSY